MVPAKKVKLKLNESEEKRVIKGLGLEPRPVPQSLDAASHSVLLYEQVWRPFRSNIRKNWSLTKEAEESIGAFLCRLTDDVLLFLKGILERKPDFPRKDQDIEYAFGIPMAYIVDCVTDEIKMVKAGPVVRDQWKLILDELTDISVKEIRGSSVVKDATHTLKSKKSKSRKKLWKGNKKEFCLHVKEQYAAESKQYASLRNAAIKIFSQFRFSDKTWTVEKCYGFIKQLPKLDGE